MKTLKKSITYFPTIVLLILTSNSIALSKTTDLNTVVKGLQNSYEKTKTIKANFRQESKISSLNQLEIAYGVVHIKKPGLMRWEYKNPEVQLIISNKKDIFFYVPEDEQVIKGSSKNLFSANVPAAFLAGSAKLKDTFNIKFSKNNHSDPKNYILDLAPKVPQPTMALVVLKVDENTFQILESSIHDAYENVTKVIFEKISINGKIKDQFFNFQIPEGVDVIEQ